VAKDVVFVLPKKEVISLHLEPKVIKKLRELADKEGLPPTTYAGCSSFKASETEQREVDLSFR